MTEQVEQAKDALMRLVLWNLSDVGHAEIKKALAQAEILTNALIAAVRVSALPNTEKAFKAGFAAGDASIDKYGKQHDTADEAYASYKTAQATDQENAATTEAVSGPRYCVPCDESMKARECKACGMPTEKVPNE